LFEHLHAMVRITLAVAGLLLAPFQVAAGADKTKCALDGSAAANDAIDATINIWAATQRCKGVNQHNGHKLRCSIDILSSLAAVTEMSTTIAKAVEDCNMIPDQNAACGIAASDFVASTTALAAVTADTNRACGSPYGAYTPKTTNLGNCAIDVNSAIHEIFDSAAALRGVKEECNDEKDCAMNALRVMSAMSALGGAISSGFDNCEAAAGGKGDGVAGCTGDALRAFAALSDVTERAIHLSRACNPQRARLYSMAANESMSSSSHLFVTALVAVAATVIGFAGGLRFKRKRGSNGDAYGEPSDSHTLITTEEL
jgi:hypothetical protein